MATSARSQLHHINDITGAIVNSAMKVHSRLGPGLLESAYQACLAHELRTRGFEAITELPQPVIYEGKKLEVGYRIDLVVERRVVVEVKSVEAIHPIHEAQISLLHAPQRNSSWPANQLQRPASSRRD